MNACHVFFSDEFDRLRGRTPGRRTNPRAVVKLFFWHEPAVFGIRTEGVLVTDTACPSGVGTRSRRATGVALISKLPRASTASTSPLLRPSAIRWRELLRRVGPDQ